MEIGEIINYESNYKYFKTKDYYPSNIVPIIVAQNDQLVLKKAKWGFKAFADKLIINARSETLLEKPLFKKEVFAHRCLIPASGFYEWDEHKHRFTFKNKKQHLMMLAGLYRLADNHVEVVIITTKANESMLGIHERMPLLLNDAAATNWLSDDYFLDALTIVPEPLMITSGIIQNSLF